MRTHPFHLLPHLLPVALTAACALEAEPVPQLEIFVTTDAPVPAAEQDGAHPPALFDRLQIDVLRRLDDGKVVPACGGCSRTISVTHESLRDGLSLGVVPEDDGSLLRLRLYRSVAGAPDARPDSTIEVWAAVPDAPTQGTVPYHAVLRVDDVAFPVGSSEAPIDLERGRPPSDLPGSWASASRTACSTAQPAEGSVCVPGGAFWMGDPLQAVQGFEATRERIVVLSPFWIAAHELTVAEFRETGLADDEFNHWHETSLGERPLTDTDDPDFFQSYCTYAHFETERDVLPITCMSWQAAHDICQHFGGDLPTEAQLAYVASGLESSKFVWGDATPACGDVIYASAFPGVGSSYCYTAESTLLPAVPGSGALDRVAGVDGAIIVDVAGNVKEYARDTWQPDDSVCWYPGIHVDPLCDTPVPEEEPAHVLKGGDWLGPTLELAGAFRGPNTDSLRPISAGVRCMWQDAPVEEDQPQ